MFKKSSRLHSCHPKLSDELRGAPCRRSCSLYVFKEVFLFALKSPHPPQTVISACCIQSALHRLRIAPDFSTLLPLRAVSGFLKTASVRNYFRLPKSLSGHSQYTTLPTICSSATHPTAVFLESTETLRLSPMTKTLDSGT